MNKNKDSASQTIKQNVFMATDVLSMELVFEKIIPKKKKGEKILDQHLAVFDEVEEFLTRGPTWEFNPTNRALLHSTGSVDFLIDKKKLIQYVEKESTIDVLELDIHNEIALIKIPIQILIANAKMLPSEVIDKSSYHAVKTLFGKIEI